MFPNLIERSGVLESGSITAIYTVLAEGDDLQDPIADLRASLDGHIVLSDTGRCRHYPAVDIEKSVSRSMLQIASTDIKIKLGFFGLYSHL